MKKLLKKQYLLPLISVLIFLVFLIVIGINIYKAIFNQTIKNALTKENTYAPKNIKKNSVLLDVNQLFKLFPDQNVTIAKIIDIKALSSKYPVFKNAENNDYLIFYPNLVIVYNTQNKAIVNIVNINLFK